ncbi:MAG: type II/IV secretion system protein, partial [Variibacter sp.]|nr:type II/IV secretion system protein [Variibacter sp.]
MKTLRDPAAVANALEQFRDQLVSGRFKLDGLPVQFDQAGAQRGNKALERLWELTELSAQDFADEVAHFFGLRRVGLGELLAATSLAERFSHRFLKEAAVFAYQSAHGLPRLAVGDPTDHAVLRAAEIVLGPSLEVEVASFEDIETVLRTRLEDASEPTPSSTIESGQRDDDVDSLRDLASGAPVVRAVNDLLERAVELRATDIHIEPFRAAL